MTAPLVPCDACARHVRADADCCPFCAAARAPQEIAYVPVPRMSRSALAALGAVLAVAPVAALVTTAHDADAQTHHPAPRPLYGVPPRPLPPGLLPPRRDAGLSLDASVSLDAGARDAAVDAMPIDAHKASDATRRATRDELRRLREEASMPVPLYGVSPKSGG